MRVAVVGVGRVGLPLAAVSSKRHETIGIDIDANIVRKVNEKASFVEPELDDYLKRFGLKASTDFGKVKDCELVHICIGTQAPGEGYSSGRVMSAIERVIPFLGSKTQVINIVSTLPPTAINSELLRLLNRLLATGVCYNPTMIALGNAIHDFENPNYLLIGESTKEAGRIVESFWKDIVGSNVPVFHSSLINIALAKYALNTALVLKITLMNLLTELCEKCGGDVEVLSEILKAEPRVAGPKMFKGGLGYGGTCFPVDVEALLAECKRNEIQPDLAQGIERLNNWQVERTVNLIKSFEKSKVAVLGLTYKPNTSILVASQALQIAERLASERLSVTVYDPHGLHGARELLGNKVRYASSKEEAISSADAILLAVEWPEFSSLEATDFKSDQIVVDPWRILRNKALECKYYGFGLKQN